MLPEDHPDAWNVAAGSSHWSPQQQAEMPSGASLVVTPAMEALSRGMPSAIRRGAIILVSGPSGSGKTTAVEAAIAVTPMPAVRVELEPRTRTVLLWVVLATALTGCTSSGAAHELRGHIRDYLTAHPTLIVVDEAQNVGLNALLNLRWLAGLGLHFTLLLAGAGLNEYVAKEPQLASRVSRRILLDAQPPAWMIPAVRQFHPVFAQMPQDLLLEIDEVYGRGLWRPWAHLAATLVNDFGVKKATREDVHAAIHSISGRPPW